MAKHRGTVMVRVLEREGRTLEVSVTPTNTIRMVSSTNFSFEIKSKRRLSSVQAFHRARRYAEELDSLSREDWNTLGELGGEDVEILRRVTAAVMSPSVSVGFLHVWSLFAYLAPRKSRPRVYTPAAEDLRADYLESFARFPGFWSRLLLRLFFTLRTAVLVVDCWRVLGIEKVFTALARVVPERVKRWWVS